MKLPLAGPHRTLPIEPVGEAKQREVIISDIPENPDIYARNEGVNIGNKQEDIPASPQSQRGETALQSSPGIEADLGGPTRPIFSTEVSTQETLRHRPASPVSAPPAKSPAILRFLPFLLIFFLIGIVIFLVIRFLPGFFPLGKSPFSGSNFGGPVKLVYWGLWEEPSVMDAVIKEYQREHPNVTIVYEKQNIRQYRETLMNRFLQEGGPDIFRFHNTWVPMLRDYLAPVPTNVYTKEEFERTFYPVAVKDLRSADSFVGIPLEIDTLALFINEDDFRAAGLSPPKTWKELLDAAYKIRVFDNERRIKKAGVALGTFDNIDHASDILALMMLQNGVNLKRVDKSTTQDGSRNLGEDTLAYYVRFSQGENRVWDDTLDPSTLAFTKEKLAMYFGYSWRVFEIKSANPSLKFKIVPFPRLFDSEPMTFASYWVEGVSKKSRFQKEAFDFLKFLSQAETMEKLYAQQARLRLFGEPYSRLDLAGLLKNNELISPFVEGAKHATSWYLASNTYDNGVNDRMISYFADAIRSVGSRNLSPKTALETAGKGVASLEAQYGF